MPDETVAITSIIPDCTNAGEEICICTDCETVIDARAVEALGHDGGVWKIDFEATTDHDGQMSRYCSKCDEILEINEFKKHEHTEGYAKIISTTCTKYGREEKNCPVCGAAETEEAQHTSFFGRIFYPVIVFFGNIVHKIIWIFSLNWLFPELTITPKI